MSPEQAAPSDRTSLAEDELRRILARAASLDAERVTGVTVDDLRQIAMETGISTEALAIALREAEAGRLPVASPAPEKAETPKPAEAATRLGGLLRRTPGWIRTSVIAWGSAITGFLSGATIEEFRTPALAVGALIALVWGSIELGAFHRKRGSLLTVQRDLIALWLPFATIGALMLGNDGDDFFRVSAIVWLAVAIIAGLITSINPPRDKEPDRRD